MRRYLAISAASLVLLAVTAAPAGAQSLSPTGAVFPATPFRTNSAPITFTLTGKTEGGFGINTAVGTNNTYSGGTFSQSNNCPEFLKDNETCRIRVVFAPYTLKPAAKSGTLFAGGLTAHLSGRGYTPGSGKHKGKKCKGKKKRAAVSRRKCGKKKHKK